MHMRALVSFKRTFLLIDRHAAQQQACFEPAHTHLPILLGLCQGRAQQLRGVRDDGALHTARSTAAQRRGWGWSPAGAERTKA